MAVTTSFDGYDFVIRKLLASSLALIAAASLAGCAPQGPESRMPAGLEVESMSVATGPVTGGTKITITGTGFENVDRVAFGSVDAESISVVDGALEVVAPPSTNFTVGSVPIMISTADAAAAPTGKQFEYAAGSPVSRQLAYLGAWWKTANRQAFGKLDGTDCVNFTSQGLLARGFPMNGEWWHSQSNGVNQYGRPWISSTALRDYLLARPDAATELEPTDLSQLAVGDIAQFDWDNSGNRDHTATVSKITGVGPDREVFVVGHSPGYIDMPVYDLLHDDDKKKTDPVVHYIHLID